MSHNHEEEFTEHLIDLPLQFITRNKNQPRRDFDETSIAELAQNIQQNGLIQPIRVRQVGEDKYEIVAGERRFRAHLALKRETITALLCDHTDEQSALLALSENIQREDLNPLDEATAVKLYMTKFGITDVRDLVSSLGKSRPYLSDLLKILRLPDAVAPYLKNGTVTKAAALHLVRLGKSHKEIIELCEYADRNGITARQMKKRVDQILEDQRKVMEARSISKTKQTEDKPVSAPKATIPVPKPALNTKPAETAKNEHEPVETSEPVDTGSDYIEPLGNFFLVRCTSSEEAEQKCSDLRSQGFDTLSGDTMLDTIYTLLESDEDGNGSS